MAGFLDFRSLRLITLWYRKFNYMLILCVLLGLIYFISSLIIIILIDHADLNPQPIVSNIYSK